MKKPRPSLFWTFAGSFLLVLLLATVLQGVAIVTVVNSLAGRWTKERAEALVRETGTAIAAMGPGAPEPEIARVLRERSGVLVLAFRGPDGRLVLPYRFPPPVRRRIHLLISGGPDSAMAFRYEPDAGPPRPGPEDGPPAGEMERPPRPGPLGPPVEWRGGPGDPLRQRFRIVTRNPLPGTSGEVVALVPWGRFAFWPEGALQRLLLFLPIALLLAGVAGTFLFRGLIHRLRAMEDLASRISAGDLEARVPESGDEIGRLGAQLNRMTETLEQARRTLEENDAGRRRLLADITHELATPLTSIRGYTETLLNPSVPVSPEEQSLYLRNVLEESERMNRLIGDLLDLSRLEAGVAAFQTERLDWAALCRNTIERFRPLFREAGLELAWTDETGGAWTRSDGRRLEQVIENLLVNALRYVPSGGRVDVTIERVTAGEVPLIRLVVRDNGPGLPAADLPHLFDRFFRAEAARSRPGSGLGLAIVKEIVTRHGGTVRSGSVVPHGLSITIDLPAGGG